MLVRAVRAVIFSWKGRQQNNSGRVSVARRLRIPATQWVPQQHCTNKLGFAACGSRQQSRSAVQPAHPVRCYGANCRDFANAWTECTRNARKKRVVTCARWGSARASTWRSSMSICSSAKDSLAVSCGGRRESIAVLGLAPRQRHVTAELHHATAAERHVRCS